MPCSAPTAIFTLFVAVLAAGAVLAQSVHAGAGDPQPDRARAPRT